MEQVYRETAADAAGLRPRLPFLKGSRASLLSSGLAILLGLTAKADAEAIALWTFETNPPADISNTASGPSVAADLYYGVGSALATGVHAGAGADWSTPAGNGSANAFSSTVWAAGDYYQFTFSSANYEGLVVTWDQIRSSTGPGLFDFAYSLDGTNFTTFLDDYTVPAISWSNTKPVTTSSFMADLSSIPGLDNAAQVTFRLIAAEAGSRTTGTNRIDNFLVSGIFLETNFGSLFWDGNGGGSGLGGSGSWNGANWSDTDTGAAAVHTFDGSKKAIFAGAGGTVTIDADVVASNGIHFDAEQYTLSSPAGHTLTLEGAGPNITVASSGQRATISTALAGASGFTKFGEGTLLLDADNSYTGQTTITGGAVEITRDRSLGASSAGIALNGGALKTVGNITLNGERTITGSGTLDVAPGTTLAIDGSVNASSIALAGGGTIQMNGPAILSRLIFDSTATLHSSAPLNINGNITANHTGGTSIITSAVNFGKFTTSTGNRAVTISDPAATLAFAGPLTLSAPATSSNGRLHKLGLGTLELTGDNSALFGVRLGSAATSSGGKPVAPVDGGTLRIDNKSALGTGIFQFYAGTLHIARPLTGANAIANAISLGASSEIPAVISGADVEFTGEVQLFYPNAVLDHMLIVNTNVLLSGPFNEPESISGFSSGLTIGGTGSVTFAAEVNTIVEPIIIDGPTVVLNGSLSESFGIYIDAGTLKGNGSLPFGALVVGDGTGAEAIFSPGDGVVTYELGSLSLDADAVLKLQVDSFRGASDRLIIYDSIYLGEGVAKLELTDLGSAFLPIGLEFTLMENNGFGPAEGYFAGMPHLHRFSVGRNQYEIDYGSELEASNVVLRVVPEPGTAALLITGALLGIGTRRPRCAV